MTRVLPEPAPATTSSGPGGLSTASTWDWLSSRPSASAEKGSARRALSLLSAVSDRSPSSSCIADTLSHARPEGGRRLRSSRRLISTVWRAIYVGMHRTTVYLDDHTHERLQRLAEATGRTQAAVIREAIAVYSSNRGSRRAPRSVGMGASASGDLSERAEELLEGFGEDT